MSGVANDRALNAAFAAIDDSTLITFRPETYQLDEGVRILRGGHVGALGAGSHKTTFEYTSHGDPNGAPYVGAAIVVGQTTDLHAPQPVGVVLSGFRCSDKNTHPITNAGHQPSAIDAFFVDELTLEDIGFENVKGNACFTINGKARNNRETATKQCTVKNCWLTGHEAGGWTQGDGFNIGGVEHYDLLNNRIASGGVGRHFFEGGTACKTARLVGNHIDMAGRGLSCFASMTVLKRAILQHNRCYNWGPDSQAALYIAPDDPTWTQGDVLPVRGLSVRSNTFASRLSPFAAVVFGSAELYDHDYLENAFDCVLPFYVGATPKGRVTIRDNSAFDVVNTFIAVRPQAPLPNEILDVGGNAVHTRNRNLKVFDRDDYAHSPRVHNLRTNTILVEGG